MTVIGNLIFPAYNLIRGRDYKTEELLDYAKAKADAEKFLLEAFKISMAVGGYLSVTMVMATAATPLTAYTVGIVILGGAYLITSRFSEILHDITKITIGLMILKKGLVDQAIEPFVQAVKTGAGYAPAVLPIPVTVEVIKTESVGKVLFKMVGIPFLRLGTGMASLSAGFAFILDDFNPKAQGYETVMYNNQPHIYIGGQNNPPPPKALVDRLILGIISPTASILVRIRGYRDTDP